MKNFLFLIALAGFAFIGAAQNAQTKKTETKKTTAVKKSPTPAKKTASAVPVKKTAPNSQTSTSGTNAAKKTSVPKPAATTPAKKPAPKRDDKAELDAVLAITDPEQKITALSKFLKDFPRSELRPRAAESLTAARAAVGDAKLEAGDRENGLKLTRLAIKEAPIPYPEKLFTEVIARVPTTLALRGEHSAAVEIASAVEKHSTRAAEFLALANFYLSTENADEARRLAEAALKLDDKSRDAYLAVGMANRLNFDLEGSSAAFEKAAELDPGSVTARQSLAEMKRALGKPDEAAAIYSTLLEKDGTDVRARDGRILALFDSGKRSDAETELAKAIEANPGNFVLLAGAAYWYAAKGESTKAIDLAGKAIAAEPRYVWSHIALGRAYLIEGRYADAEQALLRARVYGNFPSLDYELAAVRFAAGFYREAAEELEKSFSVKDGNISTKLGRRVERSEKSITDLVAHERRASILQPTAADDVEMAAKLKALLELRSALSSASPDAIRASELTEAFAGGADKMRFYRQIYAANELLEKKVAPAKALELSRSAVGSLDDGLNVPSPAGAMMASELYTKRAAAFAANRYIVVPDVSKQTLSSVARGRIEEIAGWSLLQQGSSAEAATRLRRAINVLPEKKRLVAY
jgi:tetratricopeptide (TPR) repeat protein